ncbi:MAG: DegT/DnrJ/EryC1/StrS family aminotransferase [Nevskiaceae bacterium]|jgi:dTDP-4-amino-4,6-dideoxygalactose transaminase|nr:DegT/DnrJ/EryC1/StrS family aminotransferase [Nevskiaceae bacterium]
MKLSPVRSPVCLRRQAATGPSAAFAADFQNLALTLYDSGTAALTTAIRDAVLRHRSAQPQVILPAYGCPQLVSACLYAGAQPRIVDVAANQWGYDLTALQRALNPDTAAIVAANLLGIGDQAAQLLPLARDNGSLLIQDSAQHLPAQPGNWCGDYVVLSFGRGKPLNLLRGGALAIPAQTPLREDAPLLTGARARLRQAALGSRAAGLAFNVITHPRVFGPASHLPGLGLGATTYDALTQATRLPPSTWSQLNPAYAAYARREAVFPWDAVLPGWQERGLTELTCADHTAPTRHRRLRLALLAPNRVTRDTLLAALDREGLGGSAMYGVAIDAIANIPPPIRAQGPFPNAAHLADRLLTLPTHAAVTPQVVAQTDACLRRALG